MPHLAPMMWIFVCFLLLIFIMLILSFSFYKKMFTFNYTMNKKNFSKYFLQW